ncbi:MAG: hypothetical protein J5I93_25880 [Pirellulaceae bacterium]|nr:hypothetical protein [Pirellulaceae bacterium]
MRLATIGALLLLGLVGVTQAQAQVQLRWKFESAEPQVSTSQQNVSQVLSIAGNDIATGQEQTVETSSTFGQKQADGSFSVETRFTGLKSKLTLPGGVELKFDSSQENPPAGTQFDFLLDVFKGLSKMRMTTSYDRDARVVKVVVDEKSLEGVDETGRALLKEQIDPEFLRDAIAQEMKVVPDKPVSVGDTWDLEKTMRLSGGQSMIFTVSYKYEGTVDRDGKQLDKISGKATKVEYRQTDDAPLKVTASDLKVDSSASQILFDRQRGQVVERQEKTRVMGSLTFELAGNPVDGKLDLTLENKTVVK